MMNGISEGIFYKRWAVKSPRAVFLLVHGLGAHGGRWEAMADFFADKGIASYAVELRDPDNAGQAARTRESIEGHCNKVLGLAEAAARENPWKNIFLIGESLGAIVSLLAASGRPRMFKGLICISPAFKSVKKLTPAECARIFWLSLVAPDTQVKLPFDSAMCTRDAAYIDKLDHDKNEYRTIPVRFISEILSAQSRAKAVRDLATPVLFLLAAEDSIVDPRASRDAFGRLTTRDKTLLDFPGMYHALSIDSGKEKVFDEILKWVERRMAP